MILPLKIGISSLLHPNGERVKLRNNLDTPQGVSQPEFMLILYQCVIWEWISINNWCQLKIHTKQCSILSDNSYWTVLNAIRGFNST